MPLNSVYPPTKEQINGGPSWQDPTFKVQKVGRVGIVKTIDLTAKTAVVMFGGKDIAIKLLVVDRRLAAGVKVKICYLESGEATIIPADYPFRAAWRLHLRDLARSSPAAATMLWFMRNNRKRYEYARATVVAALGDKHVQIRKLNGNTKACGIYKFDENQTTSLTPGDPCLVHRDDTDNEVVIMNHATDWSNYRCIAIDMNPDGSVGVLLQTIFATGGKFGVKLVRYADVKPVVVADLPTFTSNSWIEGKLGIVDATTYVFGGRAADERDPYTTTWGRGPVELHLHSSAYGTVSRTDLSPEWWNTTGRGGTLCQYVAQDKINGIYPDGSEVTLVSGLTPGQNNDINASFSDPKGVYAHGSVFIQPAYLSGTDYGCMGSGWDTISSKWVSFLKASGNLINWPDGDFGNTFREWPLHIRPGAANGVDIPNFPAPVKSVTPTYLMTLCGYVGVSAPYLNHKGVVVLWGSGAVKQAIALPDKWFGGEGFSIQSAVPAGSSFSFLVKNVGGLSQIVRVDKTIVPLAYAPVAWAPNAAGDLFIGENSADGASVNKFTSAQRTTLKI